MVESFKYIFLIIGQTEESGRITRFDIRTLLEKDNTCSNRDCGYVINIIPFVSFQMSHLRFTRLLMH